MGAYIMVLQQFPDAMVHLEYDFTSSAWGDFVGVGLAALAVHAFYSVTLPTEFKYTSDCASAITRTRGHDAVPGQV